MISECVNSTPTTVASHAHVSRADLAQRSRSSTDARNFCVLKKKTSSPFAPCRHRHSLYQTQHIFHSTQRVLTSYADHKVNPYKYLHNTVDRLAILPSKVHSQNALHESSIRPPSHQQHESRHLIDLTSFHEENQLSLCARTSREEVGRWSVDRAVECGFGAEDSPSWNRPAPSCTWLLGAEEIVRHLLCGLRREHVLEPKSIIVT